MKKRLVPYRKTVSLVKQLAKDYILVAVSNTAREWFDYEMDEFNLRSLFVAFCTSYLAKARKPAPEFFEYLLAEFKKANLLPKEGIFIDDRDKNTKAAAEYGFKTIVFTNPSNLLNQLQSMGIAV